MATRLSVHAAGYELEMRDEPTYTPGSTDNPRTYEHEYLLSKLVGARHALVCRKRDVVVGSAIVVAGSGCCGVHERAIVVLDDRAYAAVGDHVVCLEVPGMTLVWKAKPNWPVIFGVHVCPANDGIIVHGEIDIVRLSLDGETVWSVSGADIFTGEFSVHDDLVRAQDFNGREYAFDIKTGREESA